MTLIVCIKQVPASNDVKIDPATGNLIRDGIEGMMNPFDKNAVEAALQIKQKTGEKVVALSMGPPQFIDALREALAMGCDDALLLSSRAFGGADTLATAYVLSKGIEKIGDPSIIFFGRHAVDADTGQVGPLVAGFLNLEQVTFVKALDVLDGGYLKAVRLLDRAEETVKVRLPAVVTVTDALNQPRYPLPIKIIKAAKRDIPVCNEKDLGCDPARIGAAGSPTIVTSVFPPPKPGRAVEMLTGKPDEAAIRIREVLSRKKIV